MSQEGVQQVAGLKGKGKAMPSTVPKAADPHIKEPQASQSARRARRKQEDLPGVDKTETED